MTLLTQQSIFVIKQNTIDTLVVYISIYCSIIPATLLLIGSNKKGSLILIGIYSIYSIVSDVVISKFFLNHYGSEIIGYRIFTLIEFLLLISYLYISIKRNYYKRYIILSATVFICSIIYDVINHSLKDFDSLPTGIEAIILIIFSILCLLEILNSNDIFKKSKTWISFGIIIYFSGSFFLFILSSSNLKYEAFANDYAMIVSIFNILKNLLFSAAVIVESKIYLKRNLNSTIA